MVTRRVCQALAPVVAVVVLLLAAPPAYANWIGTGGKNGGGTTTGVQGTQSGSGGGATMTVRNCFLYATSSSFGMTCVSGGATGTTTTVHDILGDQFDDALCWDTSISPTAVSTTYGITVNTALPYYVHSCITGLVANRSLYDQPNAQINKKVYEIGKDCATPPPYKVDQAGQCVMSLTDKQKTVVDALANQGGQIPGVTLVTQPSTTVRTNEQVTYVDAPLNPDGTSVATTAKYQVGGVAMWAQRTAFKIYPYGPGTTPQPPCSGASSTATVSTQPGPCVWAYPKSSADQPNQMYPFRAEADWTVYIDDGTGPRAWQSFQKYDDVPTPVYDIQTLVVGG